MSGGTSTATIRRRMNYANTFIIIGGNTFVFICAVLLIIRLRRLLKSEQKHKGRSKGFKRQTVIQLALIFTHSILSIIYSSMKLAYQAHGEEGEVDVYVYLADIDYFFFMVQQLIFVFKYPDFALILPDVMEKDKHSDNKRLRR